MQKNLDDIVTQSAARLMNVNVKKTKEMQLKPCAAIALNGNSLYFRNVRQSNTWVLLLTVA